VGIAGRTLSNWQISIPGGLGPILNIYRDHWWTKH